ncbi:hypothetical protein LA6_000672 [Marinibacterium anthonyi]|nr:hypothetical protein LA6_000672 [Marinibacterium anthonyi]
MFGITSFKTARPASVLAILMSTTAISPALADCTSDGNSPASVTCTGDVSEIFYGVNDQDVISITVNALTSDMTGDSDDYALILLDRDQASDDRTITVDLDGGYSLDSSTGAIYSHVTGVDGTDNSDKDNEGYDTRTGAAGGDGSDAPALTITISGTQVNGEGAAVKAGSRQLFDLSYTGGMGGGGGEGHTTSGIHQGTGGKGGDGGVGGDITVTLKDDVYLDGITTPLTNGSTMLTTGGTGGNGGEGRSNGAPPAHGGDGGAGGNGGDIHVTATSANNAISVSTGRGIMLVSQGGDGGDGGKATTSGHAYPGNGGGAGSGGDITLDWGGSVTTTGDDNVGIYVQSHGGIQGQEGNSGGWLFKKTEPASSGDPGEGGAVTVTLQGASVSTDGASAFGLLAHSVGGMGNAGTDESSIVSYGESGGSGGAGGDVTVSVADSTVATSGDAGIGIIVNSSGGGGGSGGSSSGLDAIGGSSGAGGNGGKVSLSLDASTVTTEGQYGDGVVVLSVGGGGGNSGGSSGIISSGGTDGQGGAGQSATLDISGSTVSTKDAEAAAILVASVGGGGGNAHSSSGLDAIGASGGDGGSGGTVTYTSTGDSDSGNGTTVSTSGSISEGIALISVGGGGGKASASFKLSVFGGSQRIGAKGAIGGDGGDITFAMSDADSISTAGHASEGILAVSVGGGGGKSGSVTTVDVINDGNAVNQAMGATGGAAGKGGDITGTVAGTITTTGTASSGVLALSVGGGGGVAGNQTDVTVGVSLNSDVGADGGSGGDAGKVDLTSSATISTSEDLSEGIVAASVGGGGGHSSNVTNVTVGEDVSDLTVSGGVGASGGAAGAGGDVTVKLDDGSSIKTKGDGSAGVVALSVGGAGGNAGTVVDADVSLLNLGVTTGSAGSSGGDAGAVTISNGGVIETGGHLGMGILAASVGGSGGRSSTVVSGTLSAAAIDMTFGGNAGAGSSSGAVSVTNDGSITTAGDLAFGILATSVGGGGGVGGVVVSGSAGVASADMTMGSSGGVGGNASTVTLSSSADVSTTGNLAAGIAALSIGGQGGAAGLTVNGSGDAGPVSGSVSLAVGGVGGDGGTADTVLISTTAGTISTTGFGSFGIEALSYGGHGGAGGTAIAGALNASEDGSGNFSVTVGGAGGDGGTGGEVQIGNAADITTSGHYSYGIVAISAGGSGGNGGSSYSGSMTVTTGTNVEASVVVGGDGGNGGTADDVTVTNTGDITTTGGNAYGIYANSIGGSGGTGGSGVSYLFNFGSTKNSKVSFSGNVYVGGSGGTGSTGGKVTVENSAAISTGQDTSYGIYAHSIGGSGGDGGNAGAFTVGYTSQTKGTDPLELNYSVTIGGDGGGGSTGGDVSVTNDASASISTQGLASYGIYAQSVGGNGGNGGNGEPDAEGWVADIYDVYEDVNSVKEQYEQIKEAKENIFNLLKSFTLDIGGSSGDGAVGGDVTVSNAGTISTIGDSATAIYAQSVGGGGGSGGDGSQDLMTSLAISGSSGEGGDSGDIAIANSATITTTGDGALGIYAQAVGGGGGSAGDIEGSIVHEITDLAETFGSQIFGGADGGGGGDGGDITVTLDSGSSISTTGENAHAIWVQSVGGGGGAMGELSNEAETASAAIGSYGNAGDSGFIDLTIDGDINVTGDGSHGVFAQSASGGSGGDTSGGVRITVSGSIKAEGGNARAILVQADGQTLDDGNSGTCTGSNATTAMCNGTSHVLVEAGATVQTTNSGSYGTIAFMSGLQSYKSDGSIYVSNLLDNYGTVSAGYLDHAVIASDGTASLRIDNQSGGKIIGSIVLTGNADTYDSDYRTELSNNSGATLEAGNTVNLGSKGYYTGASGSTISPHADKYIGTTVFFLGGSYSEEGTYSVGLSQVTDQSTGTNSVINDLISIQDKTSAAPDVTFSAVVTPSWLTAPTDSSLMSGTVKIADSDTTGTFDATGATVATASAASYTLDADNRSGQLNMSYSIDYTGQATGAVLSDNAREYGRYFSDALTSIGGGATDEGTGEVLQALGADYLNATSDDALETMYRHQMPDEALIGVAEAVQSAHALHNLLQSCPTIDPTAGLDFLHQNECTWVQATGSKRHQDATSESPDYDTSAWGLAIGSQHEIGQDLFLEFGGQIETLSISGDNFGQDGNRYSFGAALKKEIGRVTVSTTVAGGLYGLDYDRRYTASGAGYTANSDIDGRYLGAEVRASAVYLGQGGFYAKPSAALAYTHTWQDGFTESGTGSQNWDVSATDDSWLTFTPMVELGKAFTMQNRASLAFVRAGVTMALNDPATSLSSSLLGADASVSDLNSVLTTDRYQGDLSLGVEIMVRDNLSMSLLGQTSMSRNSYDYGGTARIEFRF